MPDRAEEDEDALLERLAERLYSRLNQLDAEGDPAWAELDEHERNYYRAGAEAVYVEVRQYDRQG